MTGPLRHLCALAGLWLLIASPAAPAVPSPAGGGALTDAQQRGRQIYLTGHSPSGAPIEAFFGKDGLALSEEASTCGGCHGSDGTGRPESGLIPFDVTWAYLTKSYGHVHPDGSEHPAFTVETLKSYLVSGIYPGGRRGDPSMPVYKMPRRDLDDLVAFMQLLGTLADPGVGETSVLVGTILPARGASGGTGQAIRGILLAYFDTINRAGGIYGRKIELVVREAPPRGATEAAGLPAGGDTVPEPFALLSTFVPGAGPPTAAPGGDPPLVGPFTLFTVDDYGLNRGTFYLLAGLREQALSLIDFAKRRVGLLNPRAALVYPQSPEFEPLAAGLERAGREKGWGEVRAEGIPGAEFDAAATAARLREAGVELVLFLGGESQAREFLGAAAALAWTPVVLAPGALAGTAAFDAPRLFEGRLFLAYATLPQDRDPRALSELSRLMGERGLPPDHLQATISAYCAAKLLVEGLRLSGRTLSRVQFVSALEKLYRFETGLLPPLTYTRNRRIGALGAYVAAPDWRAGMTGTLGPAEWVGLE